MTRRVRHAGAEHVLLVTRKRTAVETTTDGGEDGVFRHLRGAFADWGK